jgi:hypothetical protein
MHDTLIMTTNAVGGFDFLLGRWSVHNRKIRDNSDPDCTEWIEFDARSEVVPILLGGGNLERMIVSDPPEGDAFEGVTLRIFDPPPTFGVFGGVRLGRRESLRFPWWVALTARLDCSSVMTRWPVGP